MIKVQHLSKHYFLGTSGLSAAGVFSTWGRQMPGKKNSRELWALQDVSFSVAEGEVVGFVGSNGAGKSTLLKVLSRITAPTSGRAVLRGRVASLLEVGTGFHPDLTGRKNIYLNGTILGMKKKEIDRSFDEIVDFAGVEKFIDTPVKRYSSGMYVRLAFAVAAHLQPEILLVDEVLAVGDVHFQKKCLGKMEDVTKQGRTVLFVSHNLMMMKSLCKRVLFMEAGQIRFDGETDEALRRYLNSGPGMVRDGHIPIHHPRSGNGKVRVHRVRLENVRGESVDKVFFGQTIQAQVVLEVLEEVQDACLVMIVSTQEGIPVVSSMSLEAFPEGWHLAKGFHQVRISMPLSLVPRLYTLDFLLCHSNGVDIDRVRQVYDFQALSVSESGLSGYRLNTAHGYVYEPAAWQVESIHE